MPGPAANRIAPEQEPCEEQSRQQPAWEPPERQQESSGLAPGWPPLARQTTFPLWEQVPALRFRPRCGAFAERYRGVRVKRTLADRENIRFEMGAVGSVSGSRVIGARAGARIPPLGVVDAGASMERRVETGS